MKPLPQTILIYIIVAMQCNIYQSEDVKRFIIVSNYETAWSFYHRSTVLKESCEWNIDLNFKKQLCKDITNSYLFREEQIYEEKKSVFKHLILKSSRTSNYSTKVITVNRRFDGDPVDEHVIICLTEKNKQIIENYISEEYNLNARSQGSDYEYQVGRFIFRKDRSTKKNVLYGMAEIPAKVFVSPDYSIEHLYLQRRKQFRLAYRTAEDALCKLSSYKKARICMAVFNSKYFEGRAIYPSNIDQVRYECELKTISFQTKLGRKEARNRSYRERMLNCQYAENHELFHFYLSQAYQLNEIFIYFKNPYNLKVTLENLSTHVRLPIERNRRYVQGDEEDVSEDRREEYLQRAPDICKPMK